MKLTKEERDVRRAEKAQREADSPILRLTKDLKEGSKTLSPSEARFLVDAYYMMQDQRIRTGGQIRALSDSEEPHDVLQWFLNQNETLEDEVKKALTGFASANRVSQWAMSVKGIGPVIASGLLAHIDINKAPTVGHIWSYAGLDAGSSIWLGATEGTKVINKLVDNTGVLTPEEFCTLAHGMGGEPQWLARKVHRQAKEFDLPFRNLEDEQEEVKFVKDVLGDIQVTRKMIVEAIKRRPWNASLKVLCWKIGESFIKNSGRGSFYGKIYLDRKAYEQDKNTTGGYKDTAATILGTGKYRGETIAKAAYTSGKLPDGHIHARARRYAVKLFLAHLHEVWYKHAFGVDPPKPYAFQQLGHAHIIKAADVIEFEEEYDEDKQAEKEMSA